MRSSLRFLNLTLLWRTHHFWGFVILVFCDVAIFRGCLWTGQTNKTLPPVFRLPPGNHHLGPPDHKWSKTRPYDARPNHMIAHQTIWSKTRPYDARPDRMMPSQAIWCQANQTTILHTRSLKKARPKLKSSLWITRPYDTRQEFTRTILCLR